MGDRGPRKQTKSELTPGSWRAKNAKDAPDTPDLERPQSGKGIKKPPEYLTEEECEIWARLLPKALEMKTYKNADHDSFAQLCRSLNTLLKVQEAIAKKGPIIEATWEVGQGQGRKTITGARENPLFITEKRCMYNYNMFAMKFGFDPASRNKLQILPYQKAGPEMNPDTSEPKDPDDPMRAKIFKMMNIKPIA